MKIRSATISDIETISGIIRKSYKTVADRFGLNDRNCPRHPSNCTDEWIGADLERGVAYYLLESGGEGVGCIALENPDKETCYLERLAVIPNERNRGVGKELVEHVIREAKAAGCARISIGVIARQHELKKWYSKFGFKELRTRSYDHLPFEVAFMECEIAMTIFNNEEMV